MVGTIPQPDATAIGNNKAARSIAAETRYFQTLFDNLMRVGRQVITVKRVAVDVRPIKASGIRIPQRALAAEFTVFGYDFDLI